MEQQFWTTTIMDFFISLGVVLGGAILGGIAAFIINEYPMAHMLRLAEQLKIWAMVATIGGTFDTIRTFEISIMGGQINLALQHLVFILSAFIGAHTGTILVRWLIHGQI
jgi:hypothetical protein